MAAPGSPLAVYADAAGTRFWVDTGDVLQIDAEKIGHVLVTISSRPDPKSEHAR